MALMFYLLVFAAVGIAWPVWAVRRQTGRSAYVLPSNDTAHGYIGHAMKCVGAFVVGILVWQTCQPLGQPAWLAVEWAGWALLWLGLSTMVLAQQQMGVSWRIGIDGQHPTQLVLTGLFRWSRNPVFLSLHVVLLGLVLLVPHASTAMAFLLCHVLMQIQVRLEEAHLQAAHGSAYEQYASRVRRWL